VSDRDKPRLVYSTDTGRVCPGCGWPVRDCKCSSRAGSQSVPSGKITAKLRMEKKGRGGKSVTVIAGLPNNADFLDTLCKDLKRTCGTGGTVAGDTIELQGDLRDRVREFLVKKSFTVKG
jgi:translation initiation factor 1